MKLVKCKKTHEIKIFKKGDDFINFYRILKLQKDRFFDMLQAKYWNHSAKGYCPNVDDNEGITLESLGKLPLFYYNVEILHHMIEDTVWFITGCSS